MLLSRMLLFTIVFFAGYLFPMPLNSQSSNTNAPSNYPLSEFAWVEDKMSQMTPDERIGQLFMVAAYSNRDEAHKQSIASIIRNHHVGGLIFMQGTPHKQIELNNYFQAISKTPLLIAIDGEWGLSMRLQNTPKFPRQLMLGAIQDDRLLYDMGKEIARQCKRVGVHVNFAPVVDVNNNANNPVINDRSFGENKYNVAQKGIAYMQGMEMNGIIACAKHFPGHGDTGSDSHYTLPVIKHDKARLYDIELYPFREMVKRQVGGMMIAHLAIPALDNTPVKKGSTMSMPTTLSKKVVTDLLKNEMGYKGLIFTDALNMKGVSSYFEPGIVDVKALLAGNDVLLFAENVGKAVVEIKKAISNGEITQAEIDDRVRKILKAKYRVGLNKFQAISTGNLNADLHTPEVDLLHRKLVENALTIAKDDKAILPFRSLNEKKFASLAIGASTLTTFQSTMGKYAPFAHHTLKTTDTEAAYNAKYEVLKNYNTVVVSLHQMSRSASKNFGINQKAINFIRKLEANTTVILTVFGNPYSLKSFDASYAVLMAYEENRLIQDLAAQVLFGAIPARGKLPVTSSNQFKEGQGIITPGGLRLKYTIPEEVEINSIDLMPIDDIVNEAITGRATPGCQILIAKNGKVIWQKSYGHHTYNKRISVSNTDLYDLASITKIGSSMLGIMEMYERDHLKLYSRMGDLLPELKATNKENLVVQDILIHESGLKSWIPFYEETLPASVRTKAYKNKQDDNYCIEIAKGMYMCTPYQESLWATLADSPVASKGRYTYSDLGYYYFKKIIENYSHKPLDKFAEEGYYKPLGLATMGYKPTERFSTRSIVPTENDTKWRKQVVHGHVHDMGAAMLGGVSGHAGLFSNANDLAILMQMLMQNGSYGGRTYFKPETIRRFTSYQKEGNRRGIGFDKPEPDLSKGNPASDRASRLTFGHTGFTGTCAWADPEHELVYVFLSNRVYPKMNNYKLINKNIRTRIQEVVYQAIDKAKVN